MYAERSYDVDRDEVATSMQMRIEDAHGVGIGDGGTRCEEM